MKIILSIFIFLLSITSSFAATPQQKKELRRLYPTVTEIKNLQKSLGFAGRDIDGIIGPKTFAAYQKENPGAISDKAGDNGNSSTPPGSTLGKGSSVFSYEKDGSLDRDETQGGKMMSCGQLQVPKKCYAAISAKKRTQVCGSAKSKCYCGMFATVTFPGKAPLQVPIYNTGIEKGGGEVIDLSGECFNLRNTPTRNSNVDKNTTWFIKPNQPKGEYVKNGPIKPTK